MAPPQTLARKGSKDYAPHLVAGGIDTSSSEDEQSPVRNEKGSSLVFYLISNRLTDTVAKRSSCPHGQAKESYGCVGGAAAHQGLTA